MPQPPRALRRDYTLDDYWAVDAESQGRFEYFAGDIVAMAGGSPRHNLVAANIAGACFPRLARPSRAYSGGQRLRTADGLYSYADASIFCGEVELSPDPYPTAVNPVVVFEVLSPSTRGYDRGDKRQLYEATPSVRDIVLIEQDAAVVEHWFRSGDRFELRVVRGLDGHVELTGCAARLPLGEIYAGVFMGA
jgi:Uma2 family endonuclease